ncbi:MAG TPA: S24/S26 family peptidase [Acidobacteriaceae bacterium]|nr:S24/S26 family peptidase [Acidobacteriaceae bacterium]
MHLEAERRAACCELVADVAHSAGEVRLKLTGTSMLPAMWPGDEVTVQRCSLTNLQPGQVVLFRSNGSLVAHRIIHASADGLITRGDSVPQRDPTVDASAIVGCVVHVVRNHRSIDIKPNWRHRTLAALLRRSHLCLRLTLRLSRITGTNLPAFAPPEAA